MRLWRVSKTKTRAGLIRSLDNNSGLAQALASYYADYGDWRKLFTEVDEIDKVSGRRRSTRGEEPIQSVAQNHRLYHSTKGRSAEGRKRSDSTHIHPPAYGDSHFRAAGALL